MTSKRRSLLIALPSFILGSLVALVLVKVKPELFFNSTKLAQTDVFHDFANRERELFQRFNDQFGNDFFRHNDPFEEMKKFREEMGQGFAPDENGAFLKDPFDRWFGKKFGGGTINDISQREDRDFVYYDIQVDDVQGTSVDTKVEDGYIVISGKQERKSKEGNSIFESNFKRTFPVPSNVDPAKMQTTLENGKIVLKFPKLKIEK